MRGMFKEENSSRRRRACRRKKSQGLCQLLAAVWPVLQRAPRLWSYAVRVGDLDEALAGLARAGVTVVDRDASVAVTDPATTLGIPIEWTDAPEKI